MKEEIFKFEIESEVKLIVLKIIMQNVKYNNKKDYDNSNEKYNSMPKANNVTSIVLWCYKMHWKIK